MIGIDTSALIDLFKRDSAIKELLEKINEEIILNQTVYLELMFGINPKDRSHDDEERFYDEIFESFSVLGLDKNASKKASEIFWKLKAEGKEISQLDCTIAAVYLSNKIDTIITKNEKHFKKIKGLKVLSY